MNFKYGGRVWKYGANVDTDVIIPARYLNVSDPAELAKHCMEDIDPTFVKEVRPGDIMLAASNFGCGSSREHAPISIKASGVSCVIAQSFARIFYRNSINIGLPILEVENTSEIAEKGDVLEVSLESGEIVNTRTGKVFKAKPYPEFVLGIMKAGGLIEHTRQKLAAGRR